MCVEWWITSYSVKQLLRSSVGAKCLYHCSRLSLSISLIHLSLKKNILLNTQHTSDHTRSGVSTWYRRKPFPQKSRPACHKLIYYSVHIGGVFALSSQINLHVHAANTMALQNRNFYQVMTFGFVGVSGSKNHSLTQETPITP